MSDTMWIITMCLSIMGYFTLEKHYYKWKYRNYQPEIIENDTSPCESPQWSLVCKQDKRYEKVNDEVTLRNAIELHGELSLAEIEYIIQNIIKLKLKFDNDTMRKYLDHSLRVALLLFQIDKLEGILNNEMKIILIEISKFGFDFNFKSIEECIDIQS